MENTDWFELSPEEAYFQAALQLAQYHLIRKEIPPQDECEENEALSRRVVEMIDRRMKKQTVAASWKAFGWKAAKVLAAAVLIVNICVAVAFAVSSDFRSRVLHLFVTTYPTHSEVGISTVTPDMGQDASAAPLPIYRLTWFPCDEYNTSEETFSPGMTSVTYTFENGGHIILDVSSEATTGKINTEGMTASTITIKENEVRVFQSNETIRLVWQEDRAYFILSARNLTKTEALLAMMSVCPVDE